MTATQHALEPKTVHMVLRSFIAIARGEDGSAPEYTTEMLKADIAGEPALIEWEWSGRRRVIEAVEKYRGLSPDQQFQKGVISMLRKIEGLIVSHEMREMFGVELLSRFEHFNEKGEFQISRKHDIIAPVRSGSLITGLKFFTIGEMKNWASITR